MGDTPGILTNPYAPFGANKTITVGGVTYNVADLMTDDIYWAAQPKMVQANRVNLALSSPNSTETATTLAGEGFLIDTPIMVYSWSATLTMFQRLGYGYATVPDWTNAKQIKVSVFAKDYPSSTPVAPPASGAVQLVGALLEPQTVAMGKNVYAFAPAPGVTVNQIKQGQVAQAPDGTTVTALVTMGLMGASVEWVAA